MTKRVAIIGAGPTGLATALCLLSRGCEVELIDPWNEPIGSDSFLRGDKPDISHIAKKSKFGSDAMYQYPRKLINKDVDLSFPISATIGGLSNVWGANVWFPEAQEIGLELDQQPSLINAKEFLLSLLPIMSAPNLRTYFGVGSEHLVPQTKRTSVPMKHPSNSENFLGSSILAVDKEKCIDCGSCLSGCPTGAIFTSEYKWRELLENGEVLLHRGFAHSISKDMSIEVEFNSKRYQVRNYDKIYVACGAIATAGLLQRSGLVSSEVYLADTQVFYIPLLSTRNHQNEAKNFTLARLFFRSKDMNSGLHISIYESSPELIDRAKSSLGFKGKLIPAIFWKQILAGIGFMPSSLSGRLRISFSEGISHLTQEINNSTRVILRKKLRRVSLDLIKARLIPIARSVQIPNVGASYHVGSLQDISADNLLSTDGRIHGTSDIYVVDSASLPRIPVGPITVAAMMNAIRIVEISLHDE